jgi:hypothetical protein
MKSIYLQLWFVVSIERTIEHAYIPSLECGFVIATILKHPFLAKPQMASYYNGTACVIKDIIPITERS